MGKKKPEIMQAFSEQFVRGARERGCSEKDAREIWDNIVKFGGYGFNKSHSTAYALITYQTAWCKANHRAAFMAANLSCEMRPRTRCKRCSTTPRRAGIAVLPARRLAARAGSSPSRAARSATALGAHQGHRRARRVGSCSRRETLVAERSARRLHALAARSIPPSAAPVLGGPDQGGAFDFTGHNRGAVLSALEAALAEARAPVRRPQARPGLAVRLARQPPARQRGDRHRRRARLEPRRDAARRARSAGLLPLRPPARGARRLFSMLSTVQTSELALARGLREVVLAGLIVRLSEAS
jgi:DNA polymerase-3 subunit alpha